jgi:hypothetical protein
MVSKLTYAAMSALVGWHTFTMVVGPSVAGSEPSDSSVLARSLRAVIYPYVTLLWQDSTWAFFAPSVAQGQQLRYVVEDADGRRHTFIPVSELSRWHAISRRFFYWFDAIEDAPETHGDYAAQVFCQKHRSLHPVSITLVGVEQGPFSPKDHLDGKHPMDDEFVTVTILKQVECAR